MTQTALILGPTGRFGRNAALAFEAAGWAVRRFDRKRASLESAARGVQVIVNGWHPPYSKWATQALELQKGVQAAALANDATVIIPGNVYVFGAKTASPWSDERPHAATNPLGLIRIALEQGYRDAGVRTIVLRAGDFLDTEASGNWFDMIIAAKLAKGLLSYPGDTTIDHAWAYLPDLARAAVMLAEKRDSLARFEDVCFEGYTLCGAQLAQALGDARGQDVRLKQMAWWPLRLAQPFMSEMKHILEMRYLWNTPHALDGSKFARLVPEFEPTPLPQALRKASGFAPVPAGQAKRVTA